MTDRERMIAIMRHEPVDRAIWQPRIEHWYNTNTKLETLPNAYRDMSMLDVYDDLGCSIRAYDYYNRAIERLPMEGVTLEVVEESARHRVGRLSTPVGTLETVAGKTAESSLTREFFIKAIDDIHVYNYLLEHQEFHFNLDTYREMDELVGDRGAPVMFNLRTPLMRMFIETMGFENTIVAMHEFPAEMERYIRLMEETDQRYYDMAKACPIDALNFGDNVDSNMLPPSLMRKWTLPYYQRRTAEIRDAGMVSYPHWDGALAGLLPFISEAGFDGYEALTPEPMGDVTIEAIAEAMGGAVGGDYFMMDGIPASIFCEPFRMQEVEDFAIRVIDLFAPSLILGVSDELPPDADIERVRLVAEIVRDYRP